MQDAKFKMQTACEVAPVAVNAAAIRTRLSRNWVVFAFCILNSALAVAPLSVFAQGRGGGAPRPPATPLSHTADGQPAVGDREWSHAFRVIPLDANRPHLPSNVKLSMGDARGHWEGNTLVVDTENINDWDWLDATGTFHSSAMSMVERFAFTDSRTMEYTVTIADPKVLTRPFTVKLPYERLNRPAGFETYEEACVEGTKSVDKVGFSIK